MPPPGRKGNDETRDRVDVKAMNTTNGGNSDTMWQFDKFFFYKPSLCRSQYFYGGLTRQVDSSPDGAV